MKRLTAILFATAFLASCSTGRELVVTVENRSAFDRMAEMVEISVYSSEVALKQGQAYVVHNSAGEVVPSQFTHDGMLIFQPELRANESKKFTVTAEAPHTYAARTYGRLVPERKEDFAWENDRVAFRIYGQALIATDGPSNGIDLWYKRTSDLIVDKWYADDIAGRASYHDDHGEGLDDYKVGQTLGAGAMAPYVDGRLWLNENFVSAEVLENGPLRTTFTLTYKDVEVDGRTYSESRTFSIDAGSQLTKVVQRYYGGMGESIEVAAGLIKRAGGDSLIVALDRGYIIYAEPKTDKTEGVWLGVVFPDGISEVVVDTTYKHPHVLAVTTTSSVKRSTWRELTTMRPAETVTYYTGYGWSMFGFPTAADFEKYIGNFVEGLREPLSVSRRVSRVGRGVR